MCRFRRACIPSSYSNHGRQGVVTKRILIIAGPNGAGKTTFAREFLPHEAGIETFLNADIIAAGISPKDPMKAAVRAGRLMIEAIQEFVTKGESFAFESTLSGRSMLGLIEEWKGQGYRITIYFLRLQSVELAIERVSGRMRQGGHSVPEDTIRRRFQSGWQNFLTIYRSAANAWVVYDNSGEHPVVVEWSE